MGTAKKQTSRLEYEYIAEDDWPEDRLRPARPRAARKKRARKPCVLEQPFEDSQEGEAAI